MLILVLTCAMSACRCDYKWQTDIQETQYFYYRAMKSGDKILYYVIEGLTEEGEQLENIVIPDLDETIRVITDALEEKEREEFVRMKVIKRTKEKK